MVGSRALYVQKHAISSKIFMLGSWRNVIIEQCARVSLLSCLASCKLYLHWVSAWLPKG